MSTANQDSEKKMREEFSRKQMSKGAANLGKSKNLNSAQDSGEGNKTNSQQKLRLGS